MRALGMKEEQPEDESFYSLVEHQWPSESK